MPLYAHSFTVAPPARYDGIPWTTLRTRESATAAGTCVTIDTRAVTPGPTPATANPVTFTVTTATLATGYYRFVFVDGAGVESESIGPILDPDAPPAPEGAFATVDQVAARLGRDLTADEQTQTELALDSVAGLIRDAAGKAPDWLPDPVPPTLRAIAIEKAIGVLGNPMNLASEAEQLGAYQHSQTYPRNLDVGIFLTAAEERMVRRAIFGSNSGSVAMGSIVDDLYGS